MGAGYPVLNTEAFNRLLTIAKKYPDVLFDIALVLEGRAEDGTLESVAESYNLSLQDAEAFIHNPITGPRIEALRKDISTNGLGFRRKAAAMAESFLPKVATLVNDPETPPQVKLKGIEQLAKWAGYDQSTKVGEGGGVVVNIQINGEAKPFHVIEHKEDSE